MTPPAVALTFDRDATRAALRFEAPNGNALTIELLERLLGALHELAGRPHLRLLTIEGAGRDFSFGASIPEHAPARIGRALAAMREVILALLDVPAPTAAIVRGRCLGGGFELALACDGIFAAEDARLGLPEVNLGAFPPFGAVLLPARVAGAHATRAVVTGHVQTAVEWEGTGLLALVAPPERLDGAVQAWFTRHLAAKSAVALRHAARAARHALRQHARETFPALEARYLDDLMGTEDAVEGVAAFVERRTPHWRDR